MIASILPVRIMASFTWMKQSPFFIHRVFHDGHLRQGRTLVIRKSSYLYPRDTSMHMIEDLNMENLHREWTKEEDQLLYNHRRESIPKLASMLGRGLRGIQARLEKILDTDSSAYSRLFTDSSREGIDRDNDDDNHYGDDDHSMPLDKSKKNKLSSASEVLNRIRWDPQLNPTDFSVLYFDRLEETIFESRFDATNDTIQGREDYFVFALPEHRIMVCTYVYLGS